MKPDLGKFTTQFVIFQKSSLKVSQIYEWMEFNEKKEDICSKVISDRRRLLLVID